jgi:YD repeat-containing protein
MNPDLQILSSYLSGWTVNNLGGSNREIRYSTAMANGGVGAFETRGTANYITNPDGSQSQLVNQRIYLSEGGFVDQFAGYFTYHPTHGHIHFDDMAWGQLRIRTAGNGLGDVVAVGPKTSFCLIDINHFNPALPGSPASGVYNSCNPTFQGISVGWNDVYGSGLDGQSINVSGIPNGDYWLEVVADPLNHIQETVEPNNTTRIPISLTNLPPVGFRVQSATPVGAQSNPVNYVDFSFNQPVDPTTFTPSAVSFTGPAGAIAVTSVTQISTVKFRVNFGTQGQIGTYTMTLSPVVRSATGGLLDQNNNGTGGESADNYINIFTVTAPQVSVVTPTGAVIPPVSSIRVTYSRPMQSNTFTTADIFSFSGPGGANLLTQITGITPVTGGGLSAAYDINLAAGLTGPGAYSLVLEPYVLDQNGNSVDQNGDGQTNSADRFTANFSISLPGVVGPDTFGYDAADQLLSAAVTNAGNLVNNFGYNYDPVGNRLTEQVAASNHAANYNALNEITATTAPGITRTNEWDAENRLTAVSAGTQRTQFSYDGMGRMTTIRQLTNGFEASFRRFIWCDSTICEERNASDTVTKRYFAQGMKVESGATAGNYFYTRDHLGSIREQRRGQSPLAAMATRAPEAGSRLKSAAA